jgi:hypothetical protein
MNETIDLRNRILKMRENNDFILSTVIPEQRKEDIKKEFISEDVISENKEKSDLHNTKNRISENEDIKEKTSTKKEGVSYNQVINKNPKKINNVNLTYTNEVQFRILAGKFNEAVEVILELSDKVKKLEQKVYNNDKIIKKGRGIFYYINLKIVSFLILIPILILGVYTIPLDFFTIKLILSDIISSM